MLYMMDDLLNITASMRSAATKVSDLIIGYKTLEQITAEFMLIDTDYIPALVNLSRRLLDKEDGTLMWDRKIEVNSAKIRIRWYQTQGLGDYRLMVERLSSTGEVIERLEKRDINFLEYEKADRVKHLEDRYIALLS